MHQRHLYTLAFLLVLLAAVTGAFVTRRLVGTVELPTLPKPNLETAEQVLGGVDFMALIPRRSPAGRPTAAATGAAASATFTVQPIVELDTATGTATPFAAAAAASVSGTADSGSGAQPSPTATLAPPTPTPTASAAAVAYPFVAAGEPRHTVGDCAGASIRGVVRDAAGNPLPGVRLWRYDQWGNEQVVETKSGDQDLGQYDFPLNDTPNVHYVQVVDVGGTIVSPVIEVQHRQGAAPDATCHWIDWVRQ